MKRIPTILILYSVAALSVCPGQAQETTNDLKFRALHNPVISADGAWMAAEEHPHEGDGNVRVWSTEGDVTFTIERGQDPRISRDSRWVSALQKPLNETKADDSKNKRAGQTLVLLDTQDGSQRTFDFVLSHDWTYSYDETYTSMHLVYLQSPEMKADEEGPSKDEATKPATKPAAKERTVGTLHLIHMTGEGEDWVFQNVTEFATYERSRYVAYVVHDCQNENHGHEETGQDSLHIAGFSAWHTGWQGVYDGEKIEGLRWARDRPMLRFLDRTETTGNDGKRRVSSSLYTWQRDDDNPSLDTIFTLMQGDSEFRTLHNPVISADGAWMAAEEHPDRGDGNVRVWATEGDATFTIERGQNPRISRDSRWVSALQKPLNETTKKQRAGQTLVLLDTQDGSQRTFDFVLSHDWTYSYDETYTSMHLVYLQSPEMKADEEGPSKDDAAKPATKPAAMQRTVGTLQMVHMTGEGHDRMWENVTEFATYERDCYVAYVVHDCQDANHVHEETGRDSLHIEGFSAWQSGMNAIYDGEKIDGLRWARDRLTLGFRDSTETTGEDGKRRVNSALYAWPGRAYDMSLPLARRWRQGFPRVDTPQ